MSEKAVRRFDFIQFRFVVAGILLLAAGLKAWQLATTPLPPVVQGSVFTPLLELFNDRYLLMAVVVSEIFFALILIAGIWKYWTWLLAILAFTAFTLVSFVKGVSGESSCGCFGTVTVNPWITTCCDLMIVGLLLAFRATKNIEQPCPLFSIGNILFSWLMLALPLVYLMVSFQPSVVTPSGRIAGKSNVVMLNPKEWLNQRWALLDFVEINADLSKSSWIVVLYGAECTKCREHFEEWKNTGFPLSGEGNERIALLEISGTPENNIKKGLTTESYFWGNLSKENQWYVETPVLLSLQGGIVRQIWTEK